MSAPAAWDGVADLREYGFTGFHTIGMLRDEGAESVPSETGVWVVLRDVGGVPRFLPQSTAAHWRGMDPSLMPAELASRWLPQAGVLYLAAAPGSGVRAMLHQRVKRFLRFGSGRNVAHWDGRRIWQLAGASQFRIAWLPLPAEAARTTATAMLASFAERHGGPPFASDAATFEEQA